MIKTLNLLRLHWLIIAFILVFLSKPDYMDGQGSLYQYFYRVYFRDKGEKSISGFTARRIAFGKSY